MAEPARDSRRLRGYRLFPAGGAADLPVSSRPSWSRWDLNLPTLLLALGIALGSLYGIHANAQNNKRNCAGTVYALRVILQEIHPAPDADAGLRSTIAELNTAYAKQYERIYRFIDGDSCVDMLPDDVPPTPTAP